MLVCQFCSWFVSSWSDHACFALCMLNLASVMFSKPPHDSDHTFRFCCPAPTNIFWTKTSDLAKRCVPRHEMWSNSLNICLVTSLGIPNRSFVQPVVRKYSTVTNLMFPNNYHLLSDNAQNNSCQHLTCINNQTVLFASSLRLTIVNWPVVFYAQVDHLWPHKCWRTSSRP